MKIAFLIQAHKNFLQLNALIDRLTKEEHHCFVHIDQKSETLYVQLAEAYRKNVRVHVIDNRITVNWSGFSQVGVTLKLMQHVKKEKWKFDRIHVMSGEDFPLKSMSDIVSFLKQNSNKEFMAYAPIGNYVWRVRQYNFLTESRFNRKLIVRIWQRLLREVQKLLPDRKILKGMPKLYKGSQWFNLSKEAVDYILGFLEDHPEYLDQFEYSACADEHFFQILLLNSPLKHRVVNDNLYYIEWVGGNSPQYINIDQFQWLKKNSTKLFARKFEEETVVKLYEREE